LRLKSRKRSRIEINCKEGKEEKIFCKRYTLATASQQKKGWKADHEGDREERKKVRGRKHSSFKRRGCVYRT